MNYHRMMIYQRMMIFQRTMNYLRMMIYQRTMNYQRMMIYQRTMNYLRTIHTVHPQMLHLDMMSYTPRFSNKYIIPYAKTHNITIHSQL
jgi:hypothetical protein